MLKVYLALSLALFALPASANQISTLQKKFLRQQLDQTIISMGDYIVEILQDENGAARGDYEANLQTWKPYETAWHTGQLILALHDVFKKTGDPKYYNAARKSAEWWKTLEIKYHPELKGFINADHGDFLASTALVATVTNGTPGIIQFARLTGDKELVRISKSAGDWMLKKLWLPDEGMLIDGVDLKTGAPLTADTVGPGQSVKRPNIEGSLYLDLFFETGEKKYLDVFRKQCETTRETQDERGLWMAFSPNEIEGGYVHQRFNLWYAEALLKCHETLGDEKYKTAALKTARTYVQFQTKEGRFEFPLSSGETHNKDIDSGSAIAFGGMIWLRLNQLTNSEEFTPNIQRSLNWILTHQYPTDFPDGGRNSRYKTAQEKGGVSPSRPRNLFCCSLFYRVPRQGP